MLCRRNLNAGRATSGIPCRLHGSSYRVAPHIVDELMRANDPGCDRAGMDADARLQFQLRCLGNGGYDVEHARRERANAVCVVGLSFRNSAQRPCRRRHMVLIFSTPCSVARLSNAEKIITEKVDGTARLRQFSAQRR